MNLMYVSGCLKNCPHRALLCQWCSQPYFTYSLFGIHEEEDNNYVTFFFLCDNGIIGRWQIFGETGFGKKQLDFEEILLSEIGTGLK